VPSGTPPFCLLFPSRALLSSDPPANQTSLSAALSDDAQAVPNEKSGVADVTNGVARETNDVACVTNGAARGPNGVACETNGMADGTNDMAGLTNGVADGTNGVAGGTRGRPRVRAGQALPAAWPRAQGTSG
jgi:hypothetical protein